MPRKTIGQIRKKLACDRKELQEMIDSDSDDYSMMTELSVTIEELEWVLGE